MEFWCSNTSWRGGKKNKYDLWTRKTPFGIHWRQTCVTIVTFLILINPLSEAFIVKQPDRKRAVLPHMWPFKLWSVSPPRDLYFALASGRRATPNPRALLYTNYGGAASSLAITWRLVTSTEFHGRRRCAEPSRAGPAKAGWRHDERQRHPDRQQSARWALFGAPAHAEI